MHELTRQQREELLCMTRDDNDVECPYCGKPQDICHDDGYGYEEGKIHRQYCSGCENTFCFTTQISFYYEVHQADCLNYGKHKFKEQWASPKRFTKWVCENCGEEKPLTEDEMAALLAKDDTPHGADKSVIGGSILNNASVALEMGKRLLNTPQEPMQPGQI